MSRAKREKEKVIHVSLDEIQMKMGGHTVDDRAVYQLYFYRYHSQDKKMKLTSYTLPPPRPLSLIPCHEHHCIAAAF